MSSNSLTLILISSVFVLLLVSIYYHNYFKESFQGSPAPGPELLTKITAMKMQKPNDSEYLGFNEGDLKTLLIEDEKYSGVNPIIWNSLDKIYAKLMANKINVDKLNSKTFEKTRDSIEGINAFNLN